MILTVVDVFKPGKFPARVFFTRRWVTPDGKVFGKGGLRIATAPAFKRRAAGYMHEYKVEPPPAGNEVVPPDPNSDSDSRGVAR